MKTIQIYKAEDAVNDAHIDDVTIIIETSVGPAVRKGLNLETVAMVYEQQAEMLADVLFDSLPQGTIDRLVVQILQRKLSHYVGRFERETKKALYNCSKCLVSYYSKEGLEEHDCYAERDECITAWAGANQCITCRKAFWSEQRLNMHNCATRQRWHCGRCDVFIPRNPHSFEAYCPVGHMMKVVGG